MTSTVFSSKRAVIESLLAVGRSAASIMELTGASESYVSKIMTYGQRAYADSRPDSDDELHLHQIHAANKGRGFPSLNLQAAYRIRP